MRIVQSTKAARTPTPVVCDGPDEFQRICDALPVLIAHLDTEQRFRFVNNAYEHWFGLSRQQLCRVTLHELLGDEVYRRIQSALEAALAGRERVFESTFPHCDGTERDVEIHFVPHQNGTGSVDGVYALIADISERKRADQSVRHLNAELEKRVSERTEQLESANRELEAFCYSVSHDLRAPLRAVRGFSEVLSEQYAEQLDERGRDFLRRVRDASVQMDQLVEDLLRLSRVSRAELQPQDINLSAMAGEIFKDLRRDDPDREVQTSVQPGLTARGDLRLVRLVVDNLLRNAWKFTGKQPDAMIWFEAMSGAGDAFCVRDNGVGFDMAYAGRLFGVFQRLHSANDFQGSGVGLAIVQRVVNRHGGRVWADAKPNHGAKFCFTLPAPGDS